jgi:hypothetical protein
MAIPVGTQLGTHEITAWLGKGGMGEVYRARDTKLKREVAIKVLSDEFSCDADRVSRFLCRRFFSLNSLLSEIHSVPLPSLEIPTFTPQQILGRTAVWFTSGSQRHFSLPERASTAKTMLQFVIP